MKFALVNGQRREAAPLLVGECVVCGYRVISRCGQVRVHHWAHQAKRRCDEWWEAETLWHRDWKNKFPSAWQEVVHKAENGEHHIADVKTAHGNVIEFQHSFIGADERLSREGFYQRLTWVVDGLRNTRTRSLFYKALEIAGSHRRCSKLRVIHSSELKLFEMWGDSIAHVIFDMGEETLWWLFPESNRSWSYFTSIDRTSFIDMHLQSDPSELNGFIEKFRRLLVARGNWPSLQDYSFFSDPVLQASQLR